MSSWANRTATIPRKLTGEPFFQTSVAGFCSNFNEFIFTYIYCQKRGIPFRVLDIPNCVSLNRPLLASLLQPHPNVEFLKQEQSSKKITRKDILQLASMLNVSAEDFQKAASDIFQWNPQTQEHFAEFFGHRKCPPVESFDVGLHIRSGDKITTGEMKEISLERYRQELEAIQKKIGKKQLSIFVMTDNISLLHKLKAICSQNWTWFTFQEETPYSQRGHIQQEFNLLPSTVRYQLFFQFLAELEVMKQMRYLIVSFTSNIGRWIYITNTVAKKEDIVSLDATLWSYF